MNKVRFWTTVLFFATAANVACYGQEVTILNSSEFEQTKDEAIYNLDEVKQSKEEAVFNPDEFRQIKFDSSDGLEITADLYMSDGDKTKPFIVLCHQAGWSRGEYREIAPKLLRLGFNCMAIDQRSGGVVNGVGNETTVRAKKEKKGVSFVDAEPDIIAAAKYAKENYAEGKLLLWGSSYSSALVLRIAGEHPELMDGVLAFAPGEYFSRMGKPRDWIASSVKKAQCPIFISSAKKEAGKWKLIYDAIEVAGKTKFVPKTEGNHGSRALWSKFEDSADYWQATKMFLKRFL